MHEQTLLRDLCRKLGELSTVSGGARIVRARVALGALSHLSEARLRELWTSANAGGPAEGAVLEVEPILDLHDPTAASVILRSVTFADVPIAGPRPDSQEA